MNNSEIERIVDRVSTETYRAKSYSREYDYFNKSIIEKEAIPALRTILIQELGELNVKFSQLEAKCFAYEAIIQNSNFKPILNTKIVAAEAESEGHKDD